MFQNNYFKTNPHFEIEIRNFDRTTFKLDYPIV